MQVSKWTSLDLTSDSGAKKFAPLAGVSHKNAFLRIRKSDDYVNLWPALDLAKNIVIPGDLTLEVTLTNDTFHADSEIEANWTVTVGDTVLTFDNVVKNSATKCTLTFTGVEAIDGTITVMAKKAALVVGDFDSGVLTVVTSTGAHSSTVAPELFVMTQVSVAAENPTMTVIMNNTEFVSKVACQDLANWAFVPGTTALTLVSATWLTPRSAGLVFSGTVVAGTLSLQVLPAATMSGSDAYRAYTIEDAADTATFTQSEIAGTVDVFQYLRNDDIAGFIQTLTPGVKASVFIKDMILTYENAFDPSLEANFVYIPGGAEGTSYKVFAKLCIE